MVQEDIVVNIKTISELKGLVQTQADIQKLNRVGIDANNGFKDLNGNVLRTGEVVKKAGTVFRQFKFELLGVLFFGMAVNRFMTGLLKPAFEVVGIFEILRDTMAIFFLPVAGKVGDRLLELSDIFTSIPEPIQEFVGWMVILLATLGAALFLFATVGLGLVSLEAAFGITAAALGLFVLKTILISALVIGFILLMKNWEKVSGSLKTLIGGITIAIGLLAIAFGAPFIGVLAIVMGAFILLRTGWDALKDSLGTTGFVETLKAAFNKIIEKINQFIDLINKIPGVNIGHVSGFAGVAGSNTPEEVLGASDKFNAPQGSTSGSIPPSSTSITNDLTINISGTLDELGINQLAEEIQRQINESAAQTLEQIERSRT